MLNLLRVKVAPTTTKPSHNQHTVHRWRLRNLHTSPLKPSFIKTDGKFQNKVPLQSFYNNNKLTTAHLFGQSFYRQTYNKTVPEKYKKYSTIFSDSGEDELSAKKDDWGPAYSDPVINEIDKRRKMKWMKFIPKGIPKKHEEMVPPELHRIIPPIPLGGEHRYESKWQWPRKIYDMKQGNELFMERGREFIKWQKKWRDRWRSRPDVYKWLDQNARFPKLFITRRRTFWLVLVFLMFLYYLDYKKQTGFYLAREWEAYIRYVLKNPMLPPAVEVAAERLLNIRKDEQIHRFASKVGETLPILEIHTSRYTEPAHPNDHREDDQIKIHISQPPIPEDDTLDMHTDHLSEYKLWPIPPIRKPKPETRDYPLTKQPKADIQMIPEVPKEHLDQHTVLHPVLSGDITPTFFVGMFDQHNTRHAQDFTSTQLFDYVKWLLSWKQSQQLNNDWIANSVKKDIKFDPTHDDQREVSEEIKEAIRERAEQFKGWSLDRWNKDNPELRQIVKNLTGEKNASEDRVDHIILKLRNIYDLSRAIPASFMKAFKSADHDYMMNAVLDPHKFHEGFSGACAMVTMFFNRWIFVGSVGDFRAFVVKRSFDEHRESYHWSMSSVSFPHTPILDAEIGTRTHQHAVQNGLIVEEKGFGFGPRKLQQFKEAAKTKDPLDTTAEPHLNSYQVQKDDSVVVMVSPGVLNVVKTSEIMDMITKKMDDIDDGVDKEENVASMIVYAAAARSKDLIDPLSASVVFLNPKYHEQVPPMYEIPKLYDVKIPQKNFEFTENWADSRPNILLPLQVAAEVGEWSEKISSETSARLSKRWDMHVQPLLPEGPAVPAFFNSIKTSVSDSWKQFREFVKPAEDQVKQAMDLPQEYVETYFQQKVDDQYYRWLKRSLDGEMWPSKIHVQQFIEAARARGRDLEEADKLEEAMMFQEYIDTKSLRARAFWRRKTPPPYREEVLKFFKDKYDADLSDKSMDELEEEYEKAKKEEKEKQKKLAEDRKKKQKERAEERTKQIAEARKKKLAELEEEEEEKEAKEAVVAKKEAAEKEKKEKVAEKKAKPKALPTERQEEEVSKKEEEVPKTEKVLTKKDLEAAEKAKKEATEKEIKEREKKEREKNTEPTPQQEWNKVQENYTVEMPKLRGLGDFDLERYLDDRRRVYLDPTIIVQKYAGEYKTQPTIDTEHEWRWQDGFKPRFFNVTPEQNMEYQHVIAADVVIAAVGAAATGTPPALEEAGVVYLTQRGLDLGTPALRQVFYEPYSDETLKLVMEIEKDRKDKEQPATLEYQRRNPVFKQKKQQQQQKTQQKKKPSKTQPKEEEEEEE